MMGKGKKLAPPKPGTLKPVNSSYYAKILRHPYPFVLLAAVALILYAHTLTFRLGNLDEDTIILNHTALLGKSSNLVTVLGSDPLFSAKGMDSYRPLQNLSFFMDAQFFGSRPAGYRFSNLLFHWLTCCALFSLLTLLSIDRLISFAAALFYCVHPLFTSSVVWIPSRGDLLIALLTTLSAYWLLRFLDTRNHRYLALHLVAFAMAGGTKETAWVFPLLTLYVLFILKPQQGRPRFYLAIFPCYALIVAVYLYLRGLILTGGRSDNLFGLQPLLSNLAVLPESLAKWVFPWHLSLMSAFAVPVTLAGCLLFAILLALYARGVARRHDTAALGGFGLTWFLVFSIPGMLYQYTLVGASYDYLEHRTYLPLLGLVIFLLSLVPRNWDARKAESLVVWVGGLLLLLAMVTYSNSMDYENPARFYTAAIESNPRNALAYHNLAHAKLEAGDQRGAILDLGTAIGLSPNYASAYCMRGVANGFISQYQESLADLNRCLELKPNYPDGYFNRAVTYFGLQNYGAAAADLDTAIRMNYADARAYGLRGSIRKTLGDLEGACADWRAASGLGNAEVGNLMQANCR